MAEESQRLLSEAAVDALRSSWERQRIWSIAADGLRQRIASPRRYALALPIGTTIFGGGGESGGRIAAALVRGGQVAEFLAAATAGSGAWFARRTELTDIRIWSSARSLSEGLKSEAYQCLSGGLPYIGSDSADVLTHRSHRLPVEAHREDPGLERLTLGVSSDHRPLPTVHDLASYIDRWLNDQIERYYRPCARSYEQEVRWWSSKADVLGLLAVVGSAAGAVLGQERLAVWVPVITTITTYLAAHVSANRYEELVVAYLHTARNLEELRDTRRASGLSDAAFIDACEALLAAENRA